MVDNNRDGQCTITIPEKVMLQNKKKNKNWFQLIFYVKKKNNSYK